MPIGKNIEESVSIIDKLEKKERFAFLIANKKELIEQKKSAIKECFPISYSTPVKKTNKSEPIDLTDRTKIEVKAVANICMYMDSHRDVQGNGCWKKSLSEGQDKFYHTKNHSPDVDDAVGVLSKTYTEILKLKDLGLNSTIKEVEALLIESTVYKVLDKKIFAQYALGMIKQHSVGMQYMKLELAINDKDEVEEFITWTKHIDKIINKEIPEKYGYFWYVPESKLIEVSAVTRGSNDITPTLEVKAEPSIDTQKNHEPSNHSTELKQFLLNQLN